MTAVLSRSPSNSKWRKSVNASAEVQSFVGPQGNKQVYVVSYDSTVSQDVCIFLTASPQAAQQGGELTDAASDMRRKRTNSFNSKPSAAAAAPAPSAAPNTTTTPAEKTATKTDVAPASAVSAAAVSGNSSGGSGKKEEDAQSGDSQSERDYTEQADEAPADTSVVTKRKQKQTAIAHGTAYALICHLDNTRLTVRAVSTDHDPSQRSFFPQCCTSCCLRLSPLPLSSHWHHLW